MSIPFNNNLLWNIYSKTPDWHKNKSIEISTPLELFDNKVSYAAKEVFIKTPKQFVSRGIQFIRDAARLILKEPFRSIWTPVVLPKNWGQRERVAINGKLAGYAFIQLVFVPVKFLVALTAIALSAISCNRAKSFLDKSESWTQDLDGRSSRLEALKEVGVKKINNQSDYIKYKNWLYNIDPKLCLRPVK